jgi:hypothetical protein
MKQIREGIYETNSSSSHSIYIASSNKNTIYDTIVPDENGVIKLTGGDFGWEEEKYYSAIEKANYAAQDVYRNQELSDMLAEVISEVCGAKIVAIDAQGYIDHQSQGNSHNAFSDKDTLKEFLFNPNSYVETDNDNH